MFFFFGKGKRIFREDVVDMFVFCMSRKKEILFKTWFNLCRISWDGALCQVIIALKEILSKQGPPPASQQAADKPVQNKTAKELLL